MFFGKKEDGSKLPDLPPLPGLSSGNSMSSSGPALPEFPEGKESRQIGNMIQPPGRKDVIMRPVMKQEPQKVKVVEMEEWHPSPQYDEPAEEEMEEVEEPMPPRYVKKPQSMMPRPAEDVFVRIDKFHAARKSLSEIQHRLGDIDELVKRIRDAKMREEQELAGWEKELMGIKSRVQTISENIFEKVE